MKIRNPAHELYSQRASFYEWLFIDLLGWGKELETFFRNSHYVHPTDKILDAGCGTGIVTRVLYQLAHESRHDSVTFHAFDLTWSMLAIFQRWIDRQGAKQIELRQADVLVDTVPLHWSNYDLIVSSTMLEYLPKHEVREALTNLRQLLKAGGTLLVMITKRNIITEWLAEKWWKTNTYTADEIQTVFDDAGFDQITFKPFSPRWSNYILVVEAKK